MAKTKELLGRDNSNFLYYRACTDIASLLMQKEIVTGKELSWLIKEISGKYNLSSIPKYTDILRLIPDESDCRKILIRKPIKSVSGVLVIAIMAKPYPCPHGRCIYCPGGVEFETPMSYTGNEPITKKAQELDYDPRLQILSKINHYYSRGHDISKVELVIVGGTFPFMPLDYQVQFVKDAYDALNGEDTKSNTLAEAKALNEESRIRCVGFSMETKPDYCKKEHIDTMLELGMTRIEIGVQTLDESILRKVNRGHNLYDVFESFRIAKEAGFKIVAHMMPGLPGSSPDKDLKDFKTMFDDPRLRPDMLKIYPTLVLRNTGLQKMYEKGTYRSYSDDEFTDLLVNVKKITPQWVRIMRIQREIESPDIIVGPRAGNLRQLIQKKMFDKGFECNCIRCREIGHREISNRNTDPVLMRIEYTSSNGTELFLSIEDEKTASLFGFLRLRRLKNPHRNELRTFSGEPTAVVRELHVFGRMTKIGNKFSKDAFQHRGYGSSLLHAAEEIAANEFGLNKISVISAVGTRQYYRKFGYCNDGPYMSKTLMTK
jgi:elongator complex protein 3 (tRNA carboxymethyluridine synthase)